MRKYRLFDILIPIGAFLAVILLMIYVFFNISSVASEYSTVGTYNNNISVLQQNVSKLNTVSNNKSDLQSKVDDLDSVVPVGGDISNLVNDVISTASSFNLNTTRDLSLPSENGGNDAVSVEQLQSGDLEKVADSILIGGIAYPINITVTVEGDKSSILNYIGALSNKKRIMNIVTSTLKKTVKDNKEVWSASLTIYSYALLEKKLQPTPAKTITDPTDPDLINTPKSIDTNY